MSRFIVLITALAIPSFYPAELSAKAKCKKDYVEVSCKEVDEAKREFLCWSAEKKGELTDELKTKKCQTSRMVKKAKKKAKKKMKPKKAAPKSDEG